MSYKLKKPYTQNRYADFVCLHQGMTPFETEDAFYFLEKNELLQNGEIVINPNYEAEQAEKREEKFKSNFFNITGYGWYRKIPKGYSSAIESLNTVFNAVTVLGLLPAEYLTFYTQPDFTNAEQCTEEWLVANQTKNIQMTKEEFAVFFNTAVTIWNTQEH